MLNHPTQNLMQNLGFEGMNKDFKDLQNDPESQTLDHQEWLGLLLGYEATSRQQKFDRRLRAAKLRQAASVEDMDYRASRGLDRRALFETGDQRLDPRSAQPSDHRARRHWQKLPGLRAWPQSMP